MNLSSTDTICALSTANGIGAIAVIRVSGDQAFELTEKIFSKKIAHVPSHQVLFGTINFNNEVIDEVLVSVFKNPTSFTGEDTIEIACHGSIYIQQKILELLIHFGARLAKPGEFSMRAFSNGKMDLSQTEAIADLIDSSSKAAHQLAMNQMKGGVSNEISVLREELINFASLIELELDFSEEDVEFADRTQLNELLDKIDTKLSHIVDSFSYGNAIKNGVPVSIIGSPNAGKSTLLNQLLKDNKAIVSEIAGTTRDLVEDEITIKGISFRFIDTAGIRETEDTIEKIGIDKALERAKKSNIIIHLFDVSDSEDLIKAQREKIEAITDAKIILVGNKIDLSDQQPAFADLLISADKSENIHLLENKLVELIENDRASEQEVIITNMRHYEAFSKAHNAIQSVKNGLETGISGDLLAIDIRQSLHYLGEITGEITTDDLLGNIFSKFCIGK